jgi:hypothetical protein
MRLYRFEFSTNVERVTLALAHKGLEVESTSCTSASRSTRTHACARGSSASTSAPASDDYASAQSTSSAMRSALRNRSSDAESSSPRLRPSALLGIVNRLSQLTTPSRERPCSGPSGTSVGSPRIVPVTAATVTFASTGIARSRVTMMTGRRPPGNSTSRISPRFRAARHPPLDRMQ